MQIQTSWLENISSAVGGGDAQDLAIAQNMTRQDFDPGVRFDPDMGKGGRWREYDSDAKQMGGMVSGKRAEELGANKDRETCLLIISSKANIVHLNFKFRIVRRDTNNICLEGSRQIQPNRCLVRM